MIGLVRSLLLSLFFFIIVIWSVTKISLKRSSYSFKLHSIAIVFITTTMVVILLYMLNNSIFGSVIGYGIGMAIAYFIDQCYYDRKLRAGLNVQRVTSGTREKVQREAE